MAAIDNKLITAEELKYVHDKIESDLEEEVTALNNNLSKLGLSVVNGELCVTYAE